MEKFRTNNLTKNNKNILNVYKTLAVYEHLGKKPNKTKEDKALHDKMYNQIPVKYFKKYNINPDYD